MIGILNSYDNNIFQRTLQQINGGKKLKILGVEECSMILNMFNKANHLREHFNAPLKVTKLKGEVSLKFEEIDFVCT